MEADYGGQCQIKTVGRRQPVTQTSCLLYRNSVLPRGENRLRFGGSGIPPSRPSARTVVRRSCLHPGQKQGLRLQIHLSTLCRSQTLK
jgi:hypothetical protein